MCHWRVYIKLLLPPIRKYWSGNANGAVVFCHVTCYKYTRYSTLHPCIKQQGCTYLHCPRLPQIYAFYTRPAFTRGNRHAKVGNKYTNISGVERMVNGKNIFNHSAIFSNHVPQRLHTFIFFPLFHFFFFFPLFFLYTQMRW